MAASDIDVCSQALSLLGLPPISSFTQNRTAATCKQLYDTAINALFAEYPWDFARARAVMERIVEPPAGIWTYAFQLPSDIVAPGVYSIYRTADTNQTPFKDYEVSGKQILTDSPTLFIAYTKRPPEGEWPPHFYKMAIFAMKATLAKPVTEDDQTAQDAQVEAYGLPSEDRRGGFMRTAMTRDSQSDPAAKIEDFSLINAHLGN